MNRLPRVLVIGHYPLDTLDRAPKVRIYEMVAALARSATVTVIAGNRAERSHFLRQQKARGLKHFDMIYVETASSTATLTDIAFYGLPNGRGFRLPFIFATPIRDFLISTRPGGQTHGVEMAI